MPLLSGLSACHAARTAADKRAELLQSPTSERLSAFHLTNTLPQDGSSSNSTRTAAPGKQAVEAAAAGRQQQAGCTHLYLGVLYLFLSWLDMRRRAR